MREEDITHGSTHTHTHTHTPLSDRPLRTRTAPRVRAALASAAPCRASSGMRGAAGVWVRVEEVVSAMMGFPKILGKGKQKEKKVVGSGGQLKGRSAETEQPNRQGIIKNNNNNNARARAMVERETPS